CRLVQLVSEFRDETIEIGGQDGDCLLLGSGLVHGSSGTRKDQRPARQFTSSRSIVTAFAAGHAMPISAPFSEVLNASETCTGSDAADRRRGPVARGAGFRRFGNYRRTR